MEIVHASPDAAGFSGAGFADAGFADAGFADAGFADAGFAGPGFAGPGFAGAGFAGPGFAGAGLAGFAGAGFFAAVTQLVNDAYAAGEKGLWIEGTERTDQAEVAAIAAAGELVVGRIDGDLAGAVRVQQLPSGEGEFGMLAASFAHRGAGVGRDLVTYAEQWARDRGLGIMQLELLVPQTWRHPAKEFLREWYLRSGYRVVRKGVFATAYPALASRLATPCDFLVFHKPL